jgi:DNA-binding NtrC family response regulator
MNAPGKSQGPETPERPRPRVLIVDDEPGIISAIRRLLHREELECLAAGTGGEAIAMVDQSLIDVMLLDLRLPDRNGIEVLQHVRKSSPDTVVVIMTGHGTIKLAIEAIKEGAYEFLQKPFENDDLIPLTVSRALAYRSMREANNQLQGIISGEREYANLVWTSTAMRKIMRLVPRLAEIDSTILIGGESGTGKEVLARAIHFSGPRRQRLFVPVDCGAIPAGIIESELFGHARGAFTGASEAAVGLLGQADRGTLFLDEIGELPLPMQTKLLRFLQEREVRPLGGEKPRAVDTRVIAASNRDLGTMIREKRFRSDLYYRLNVVNLEIPPLRERKEDIPILVGHFLRKYGPRLKRRPYFSPEASDLLHHYEWPGNVRELENAIVQTLSLCSDDQIRIEDLPAFLSSSPRLSSDSLPDSIPLSLEAYERLAITRALHLAKGAIPEAAALLNLGRSTLYRKIKDLAIDLKALFPDS